MTNRSTLDYSVSSVEGAITVAQARCIRCGTVFHVNYHHRSFNASQLKKLFAPEFKLVEIKLTGGERRYYMPLLLWIKKYVGGIWTRTPTTVCPICNTHLYPGDFPERNAVSAFCNKWNEKIKHHKMLEKSHVIALYQRQGGDDHESLYVYIQQL